MSALRQKADILFAAVCFPPYPYGTREKGKGGHVYIRHLAHSCALCTSAEIWRSAATRIALN